MKAVVLSGPNVFGPMEVPVPEIGGDELLLKMERAAICGTDIRILEGKKTKDVRYPSVIGHEMAGTVAKVGERVKGYAEGERVSIANLIPCGHCHSCLGGRENACVNRTAIGYQYDGGFEEYVRIPAELIRAGNVVKLPERVSFTAGALIEPLACCIRGMRNAGTGFGDAVLIVGAGPIGLMHLQLSRIAGARKVIVSEPNEFRRGMAAALGADVVVDSANESLEEVVKRETGGVGADVVLLAIGIPALVNGLLKLCRKGGALCLFAGFSGDGECTVSANLIHYNEIHVCGSTAYTRADYLAAAEMVKTGRIDLDRLATDVFPLEDFQKAYEASKAGKGLKVVLTP